MIISFNNTGKADNLAQCKIYIDGILGTDKQRTALW